MTRISQVLGWCAIITGGVGSFVGEPFDHEDIGPNEQGKIIASHWFGETNICRLLSRVHLVILSFCSDGSHEQRNGRKFTGVGLAQWISAPIDLCFSNYSVSRQYKRKYHEQDLDSLHLLHVTTLLRITFYFLDYR
jgi:hypothetical protein